MAMDTREQPPSDDGGTWLQGRDMLPPNIPNQVGQRPITAPEVSAPVRRPRPWSLILGVPLLLVIVLGAAWIMTSGSGSRSNLLANLPGRAVATATPDSGIRALSSVGASTSVALSTSMRSTIEPWPAVSSASPAGVVVSRVQSSLS
jgi:hypothetical protein